MAIGEITNPYEFFTNADGTPLEAGQIYIGVDGLDPQDNPQAAYFDLAGTIGATQPIRTLGGYPVNAGSATKIFTDGSFSVKVLDENNNLVYSDLSVSQIEDDVDAVTDRVDAMSVPFDTVADFFAASIADIKTAANATTGTVYIETSDGQGRYTVDLTQVASFDVTTAGGVEASVVGKPVSLGALQVADDGLTDVSSEFANAVVDHNRITGADGATYLISTAQSVETSGDVEIDMSGSILDFQSAAALTFRNTPRLTTTMSTAAAGASTISLAASGAQVGDVVEIQASAIVCNDHGQYRVRMVHKVIAVSGTNVTLDSGLNFPITSGEAGLVVYVYPTAKFTLKNAYQKCAQTSGRGTFIIRGYTDYEFDRPTMIGPGDVEISAAGYPRGIMAEGCYGGTITSPHCENMIYPINPTGGTRATTVTNPVAINCRHVVDPSVWADGVTIIGQQATACFGSVNTHPAFNVQYIGGVCKGEYNYPNLRTIGGGISGMLITLRNDATLESTTCLFATSIILAPYTYVWDRAVINVDGLRIEKGGVPFGSIRFSFGHFKASNLECGLLNVLNTVESFELGGGVKARVAKFTSADGGVRLPVTRSSNPRIDAVLDGSTYVIDPMEYMVDQSEKTLRCYGSIVEEEPEGDFDVKIFTNAFGHLDQANYIVGKLKLTCGCLHNSAGNFDLTEQTFMFRHKVVATSTITMPTTPILESTPQSGGNPLTLAISNIAQEGNTEIGTNAKHNISFTVTADVVAGGPRVSMTYELELMAFES